MIWYILSTPFWVMGVFLIGVVICGMLWATVQDMKAERREKWDGDFVTGIILAWTVAAVLLWMANGLTRLA